VFFRQARRKPSWAAGTEAKASERDKAALVEGRRPGSNQVIAFDEAAAEVGSGGVS
jgi:hypothetical protein